MEYFIGGIVHGIFTKLIRPYGPERLTQAVREGETLIRFLRDPKYKAKVLDKLQGEIALIHRFRMFKNVILANFNLQYIGSIIARERPDLWQEILSHRQTHLIWLDKQIRDIRQWVSERLNGSY